MCIEAGALELNARESSKEQNDAIFLLLVYTQYWFIKNVLIRNASEILSNPKGKKLWVFLLWDFCHTLCHILQDLPLG